MWELHTFMVELPLNDFALPDSPHPQNPHGSQLALSHQDSTSINTQINHPPHRQVNSWLISHLLGLLVACRLEHEWNEDLTSSGDLMFLGAVPKDLKTLIDEYCADALVTCRRGEDRIRIKHLTKGIKAKWKDILLLLRLKPQAL